MTCKADSGVEKKENSFVSRRMFKSLTSPVLGVREMNKTFFIFMLFVSKLQGRKARR